MEERYLFPDGSTMKREYGLTPNKNPLYGRWVLRNYHGKILDISAYRNDIFERNNLDVKFHYEGD